MSDEPIYIEQSFDFLGSLERNLRDLQGYDTLAYELIQNADDVKDENGKPAASRITFDIREDMLTIENDGVFRPIDFDRMTRLAGGGKRDEADTTGAFGIGFTVVYQITDTPEIYSSGLHWRFIPIDYPKNIMQLKAETQGTVFKLPYATNARSDTRLRLKQPAFDINKLDEFQNILCDAIFFAALFLKQLNVLEVKRDGKLIRQVIRTVINGQLHILDNGELSIWYLLNGNFEEKAALLRAEFPIEEKRHSRIILAIPQESLEKGRLFAVLPTNTITNLPFHINADFFPKSDRKQIIFEGDDYQSRWNRLAIQATANVVVENFEELKQLFGYREVWQFIQSIKACSEKAVRSELDEIFNTIWSLIKEGIRPKAIVYTAICTWCKPHEVRILQSQEEHAATEIFQELGLVAVHPDLRQYQNLLLELGTQRLTIDHIVARLKAIGLDKPTFLKDTLPILQQPKNWQLLWTAIDSILARIPTKQHHTVETEKDKLRTCAIFLNDEGKLQLAKDLYKGEERVKHIFWWLNWIVNTDSTTLDVFPANLVVTFTVNDAINELEQKNNLEELWKSGKFNLPQVFRWFQDHYSEFVNYTNQDLKRRLRSLPLYPVAEHLVPLSNDLYLASDFKDPIGSTTLINLEAIGDKQDFLRELGVQELTFENYVLLEIPKRFNPQIDLTWGQFDKLVGLLASRLGVLKDREDLRQILCKLPLIKCAKVCVSPSLAYLNPKFQDLLGPDAFIAEPPASQAVRDFYIWLGVESTPRTKDLIDRILEITSSKTDFPKAVQLVTTAFELLSQRNIDIQSFEKLRTQPWLPAKQNSTSILNKWFKPSQLFNTFQEHLFNQSEAYFLDLDRSLQNSTTDFSTRLGIKSSPTVELVVQHLTNCIARKIPVNMQVYETLNNFLHQQPNAVWIHELKNKRFIFLSGLYVNPKFVFWGDHPFGQLREKLGREWLRYEGLLSKLGVREKPEFQDYCDVFDEIETETTVAGDIKQVIYRSLKELDQKLQAGEVQSEELFKKLSKKRFIPNWEDVLQTPLSVLLEDRPDIVSKFPDSIAINIVQPIEGAMQVLRACGVQWLSEGMKAHIVECIDPITNHGLTAVLHERKELFRRVLDSNTSDDNRDRVEIFFRALKVKKTSELVVQFEIKTFGSAVSNAEHVIALWNEADSTLYYCPEDDTTYFHIARELALRLNPSINIAPWIKLIIEAASLRKAKQMLDIQGCKPSREDVEVDISKEQASYEADSSLSTDMQDVLESSKPQKNDVLGGDQSHINNDVDKSQRSPAIAEQNNNRNNQTSSAQPDASKRPEPTDGSMRRQQSDFQSQGQSSLKSTLGKKPDGSTEALSPADKRDEQITRKPYTKLRSYVTQERTIDEHPEGKSSQAGEHRSQVDAAGIQFVLVYEQKNDRQPQEMAHNNAGFDIRSVSTKKEVRYIEVKSLSGDWDEFNPAAMSSIQFDVARQRGESAWLYVVERALGPDTRLHVINNPAQRVDQYLFDNGWQSIAGDISD
jgi:hypothetical protein